MNDIALRAGPSSDNDRHGQTRSLRHGHQAAGQQGGRVLLPHCPGTQEGVREGRVLARIEDPRLPPAREDARIARSPSAKVHAVGYDPAGRLRYCYHDNYRERREREKFEPVPALADRLPEVRRFTSNHLGRKRLGREKVFRI